MEELTSGDPDDWREPTGSARHSAGTSVVTLDLTDAPSASSPGADPESGRAVGSDGPVGSGASLGLAGPGEGRPPGPPRTKFATFVVTEADELLGSAYLLTGEPERAEELLRSALATAAVTWPRSRGEPAADVLRAMARERLGWCWWRERSIEAAPLSGEVGAGLTRLSGRQRVAVVLRYHQRRTEEETAAALGAPVGNVRSWLSRALDALGIDTRLDLRPEAGPGLSRSGLSTELAALATRAAPINGPPPEDASFDEALRLDARLTEVRRRLPALRRRERYRRTGTGIAIAIASVAVLAGGLALAGPVPDPILDGSAGALPPPAGSAGVESERFGPGNQLEDPNRFHFRDELAGDPLIASQVGERGQGELTLRFTPAGTDLTFSQFCHSWYEDGPWLKVTLNGHDLSLEPCSAEGRANLEALSRDRYARAADDEDWAGLGVRPGRASVLRLELVSAEGRPLLDASVLDTVRIGIAVYELSGPRVVSDGVAIKRQAELGLRYTLGGHRTARITTSTRKLSLTVPAGKRPALLLAGIPGTTSQSLDRIRVTVNGTDTLAASSIGMFTFPLPSAGPQTVSIRARSDDTGVLVLAWYEVSGNR